MKAYILSFVALCFLTMPALANEIATTSAMPAIAMPVPAATGQNCGMTESSSITVSFNNVTVEIGDVKKFMDDRIAELETDAKDAGIKKFELQSTNMNVYSNNYAGVPVIQYAKSDNTTVAPKVPYQLSGSVTYVLDDVTKIASVADKLTSKGYQINIASNAYRECK